MIAYDDSIYLKNVGGTTSMQDNIVCGERIYSRTGDMGLTPMENTDLIGIWKMTERHAVNSNGGYMDYTTDYVLEITNQDLEFIIGTCTDGRNTGTFAAILSNMSWDHTNILIGFQYDENYSRGSGWLLDDTHMIIVETYVNAYDNTISQMIVLEKIN